MFNLRQFIKTSVTGLQTSIFAPDIEANKDKQTKQIEGNDGNTLVSEGIDANYLDMINYSVFGLIKLAEANEGKE